MLNFFLNDGNAIWNNKIFTHIEKHEKIILIFCAYKSMEKQTGFAMGM